MFEPTSLTLFCAPGALLPVTFLHRIRLTVQGARGYALIDNRNPICYCGGHIRDEIEGASGGAVSPEELVLRCQQARPGDTRAFEQLVSTYKTQVFRTAYRLMRHHEDAEDLTQEVFLKVYRGIPTLTDPVTLPAWIQRITVNLCLDTLAKQKRRPSVPLPGGSDDDGDDHLSDTITTTPEAAALRNEVRHCIEAVLAQLGAVERVVLLLRDLEDRSYQEIADSLKTGLSATKMRIHRARLAFQQLFERLCPELRTVE
jgi:RNA polymerase sigma-70 factor, ECF subfamily